ncbi:MAG: heavy-metal-associated domain-containing protein [Clostridia bacterium]|nr:heavy-metal-associated domain-containing protein [Clostridia bacterium]
MQKKLHISGMTCQHCVRRVENALRELAGLSVENIDLETGIALIELAKPLDDQLLR